MSGPSIHLRVPPLALFKFPPEPLPKTLPPPVSEGTLRAPFGIPPNIYNAALDPAVPLTIATLYLVGVFTLNTFNRHRTKGAFNKPWWIATTSAFKWFVVLHNAFLTLYSLITCIAMVRAMTEILYGVFSSNSAWPAHAADALCRLHGPRGFGDAATYNSTLNIWEVKNTLVKLDPHLGTPDATDVGRLWNEGLAFWGWLFYLSKFYEVVDTLIIVAKGKRSATLQTYHHAGAMMCMWAGIRYMSPPIWMFVAFNSGIHTMMYTYFTLSALGIRVPQSIKRTLTTMQIAQFVFGASYAASYFLVQYDTPVQTPYQVLSTASRAAESASSAAAAVTSSVGEALAAPTATASIGAVIKKILLRAAGEEGIAEQVPSSKAAFGQGIASPVAEKMNMFNSKTYETRWRTDWTRVDCISSSGQAFAIYLNLFYLFPLTLLFGRFFYKAYTQRGRDRHGYKGAKPAADAAVAAAKGTSHAIEGIGRKAEVEADRKGSDAARAINDGTAREKLNQVKADLGNLTGNAGAKAGALGEKIGAKAGDLKTKTESLAAKTTEKAKEQVESRSSTSQGTESPNEPVPETKNESAEAIGKKETTNGAGAPEEDGETDKTSAGPAEGANGDHETQTQSPAEAGQDPPSSSEQPELSEGADAPATEEDTDAMGNSGYELGKSEASIQGEAKDQD